MRKRVTADSVVEQSMAWGHVTVSLLAKSRFGGDKAAARQMLGTLTRNGSLHRHLCRVPGCERCFVYYTRGRKPVGLFTVRRDYAVARCCVGRAPPITLLGHDAFNDLMIDVGRAAEYRPSGWAPMYQPCFAEIDSGGGGGRLCRIVALKDGELPGAINRLEGITGHADFRPWRWLGQHNRLRLLVLCPGRENAAELGRWLRRRPLVARVAGEGVVIPTSVLPAARLRS